MMKVLHLLRGLITSVFELVVGGPFCAYEHILHLHCTNASPGGGGVSSCECMHVYVCVVVKECDKCVAWSCWCENVSVDSLMCM